jgi:acid stress-induced BolA-like protein IbaG/YrbA
MAVIRKVKKILEEHFPPPDKVNLRDEDGIIGIVTSKRFRRMDSMQRQEMIHQILEDRLTEAERREIVIIVAVTPEEELANAGSE